jgi:hypothetical protein
MATKRRETSAKKVKSLKIKNVGKNQAKQIKGGPMGPPWSKKTLLQQS